MQLNLKGMEGIRMGRHKVIRNTWVTSGASKQNHRRLFSAILFVSPRFTHVKISDGKQGMIFITSDLQVEMSPRSSRSDINQGKHSAPGTGPLNGSEDFILVDAFGKQQTRNRSFRTKPMRAAYRNLQNKREYRSLKKVICPCNDSSAGLLVADDVFLTSLS